MTNLHRSLVIGCSVLALAGCGGGDKIVSPGTGGDIIINNPTPTPTGGGTPTPTGSVTPAANCPTIGASQQLSKNGTITGATGTYLICTLPAKIDADTTLPYEEGVLYNIASRVDVGSDLGATATTGENSVELKIESGVILYANQGRNFLVVNRGNTIDAVGTANRPIIFTSAANIQNDATDDSDGQWGGVVLLGRARVSDCSPFNDGSQPDSFYDTCQQTLEGTNVTTLFGGNTPTDSSGRMKYVQIRYSGWELATDKELQSLTLGGVGSGTTIDHVMSFNSSDDGMEVFGGDVNIDHFVVIGASDDSLDVDTGAQLDMQYVLVKQRTGAGDNLIELDSPDGDFDIDAKPQTRFNLANFTFIERSTANSQVMRLRGGADIGLFNGVIDSDSETCVRIDEQANIDAVPTFESIVADCDPAKPFRGVANDTTTDAAVKAFWDAGSNNDEAYDVDGNLTGGIFFTGTVTPFDANSVSMFFDTTAFIGAFASTSDSWYANWVCNSSILDFGSTTGPCTSLPIY